MRWLRQYDSTSIRRRSTTIRLQLDGVDSQSSRSRIVVETVALPRRWRSTRRQDERVTSAESIQNASRSVFAADDIAEDVTDRDTRLNRKSFHRCSLDSS